MQRLEHLDIEVVGERGVAADPEYGDGPLSEPSSAMDLDHRAHGDRFAAARAQLVGSDVDQGGCEVVDQAGAGSGGVSAGTTSLRQE